MGNRHGNLYRPGRWIFEVGLPGSGIFAGSGLCWYFGKSTANQYFVLFAGRFAHLHVVLDLAVARPTVTPVSFGNETREVELMVYCTQAPKYEANAAKSKEIFIASQTRPLRHFSQLVCSPPFTVVSAIAAVA